MAVKWAVAFLPDACTVVNESGNSVKQEGSGKRKKKNYGAQEYIRPHREQRREIILTAKPILILKQNLKNPSNIILLMEGLLSELDYFEPNVTLLRTM